MFQKTLDSNSLEPVDIGRYFIVDYVHSNPINKNMYSGILRASNLTEQDVKDVLSGKYTLGEVGEGKRILLAVVGYIERDDKGNFKIIKE